MTPGHAEALTRILDYLEEDEKADYDGSTEWSRDNHIFLDLCFVRGWLDSATKDEPRPIRGSRRKRETSPYTYFPGNEGCDETFDVYGPGGEFLLSVPFWDRASEAEAAAKSVVEALNKFHAAVRQNGR
jgi:hypothetical protein